MYNIIRVVVVKGRCGAEADAGVYCYPHPLPLLLYISLHIPFIILILFSQESSTTCVSPAAGTFSCAVPSIYFKVKAAGLCRGDGSQGRPWIWNQYHSCYRYQQYLRRKNRKHCLAVFGWMDILILVDAINNYYGRLPLFDLVWLCRRLSPTNNNSVSGHRSKFKSLS